MFIVKKKNPESNLAVHAFAILILSHDFDIVFLSFSTFFPDILDGFTANHELLFEVHQE